MSPSRLVEQLFEVNSGDHSSSELNHVENNWECLKSQGIFVNNLEITYKQNGQFFPVQLETQEFIKNLTYSLRMSKCFLYPYLLSWPFCRSTQLSNTTLSKTTLSNIVLSTISFTILCIELISYVEVSLICFFSIIF